MSGIARGTDARQAPRHVAVRHVVGSGSGSPLPCPEPQQVSRGGLLDEPRRLALLEPRKARWAARATEPAPGVTAAQRLYAERRARALGTELEPRVADCGTITVAARCACGPRRVAYTCRQHVVCEICSRQRAKRYGRKIREGLESAIRERCKTLLTYGAQKWRTVLLTLSVRHTGDIEADCARLKEGWRGLYKAMHRRGWGWFPYVGTIEVTPGRDGLGHVHAHVVAVWPWRDWGQVARMWRRACPTSTRINIVQAKSTRGAASYVAKYVSKGVYTADFTPLLRANVVAGMYQSRWVFTSVRFWVPWSPCCPECNVKVETLVILVRRAIAAGVPPDERPEWAAECDIDDYGPLVGGEPSPWAVLLADQRASLSRAGSTWRPPARCS